MLTLRILPRGSFSCINSSIQKFHTSLRLKEKSADSTSSSTSSSDSSDSSSSDSDSDNEKNVQKNAEKERTNENLQRLLGNMINQKKVSKTIEVARPNLSKMKEFQKMEREKRMDPEKKFNKQFVKAAEEVAESIGGDVEKIKSELLYQNLTSKTTAGKKEAKAKQSKAAPEAETEPNYLTNLLSKMDIQTKNATPDPIEEARAERAKMYTKIVQPKFYRKPAPRTELPQEDMPDGSFHIFKTEDEYKSDLPKMETWDWLHERELNATLLIPPQNYFEEMIQWTDKGLIWHFPINNEQGMTSEENVHFSEHVFMERHLQGWCPKKGPIRHFMELVCVGLSKNPYLTVQEKIDHIMWYRQYFSSKESLLQEIGALPQGHTFGELPKDGDQKSISS